MVARPLGWVADDSHHVVIGETGAPPGARGEIVDIWFPSEVAIGQQWFGWVEGKNVGDATGTFRFRVGAQTIEPNVLSPGASVKITISGYGPTEFDVFFERETPAGWVVDDSRHVEIAKAVTPPEGKKATSMVVTIAPPSHASVDEMFRFEGYLRDEHGTRLAGKLVDLHYEFDGSVITVKAYTKSDGGWSFYPMGGYSPITLITYVYFEGDAYYTGSRTPAYTTVVS